MTKIKMYMGKDNKKEKGQWGGKRAGAGKRKRDAGEKKLPVTIFVKRKYFNALGGYQAVKKVAEAATERAAKRIKIIKFFGLNNQGDLSQNVGN